MEDKTLLEKELGGALRGIEFIFKSSGVNRPLRAIEDHPQDNLNKTFYRDQVNKVANAIKEIITALKNPDIQSPPSDRNGQQVTSNTSSSTKKPNIISLAVLLIAAIGYFFYQQQSTDNEQQTSIDKSIAVLPFVNMSNDPEQEYFSDGMTDEILNRLFKIGDLKVISRTSSMKFKGAKLTVREIANQLGVTNILEGSVQKAGNRIKITVQLIDAVTDTQLFSN